MALYIRMALYFLSALVAGQGVAVFDPGAGTLTFDIESVTTLVGGALTFIATFAVGRFAKLQGGPT